MPETVGGPVGGPEGPIVQDRRFGVAEHRRVNLDERRAVLRVIGRVLLRIADEFSHVEILTRTGTVG